MSAFLLRNPTSRSYFQSGFDLTQNPLTEGGFWLQNDPLQTPMRSSGGIVFSTMDGTGPSSSNYNDSAAHISGFGQNYELRATLFKGSPDATFHEMELGGRWRTDGPFRNNPNGFGSCYSTGVEYNFDGKTGSYANIGTFKNLPALASTTISSPVDGDVHYMRFEGSRVRVWINRASLADSPIMDVTDASIGALVGDPMIGSYYEKAGGGTSQNQLGWKDIQITRLPP